ncbi:DUF563 domain-containing protein [Geitlerinema sp. P-1104]|uniref:glycosyltransferase 61 family protein n=1 Tax=Geitlerinema sp. P-1104 TaxID=2546230 RepID=UPI0014778694|nr:glycosyltransferase 61 family protein [Geitlerinema sp. P-1104]NMG60838.1 DUF563 domain-containing protein [Geitlerinema sp. P-1104]
MSLFNESHLTAIFENPEAPEGYEALARDLEAQEQYQAAYKAVSLALHYGSQHPKILCMAAIVCQFQEQFSQAEEYYRHCLQRHPLYADALYNLSFIYLKRRQYKEALLLHNTLQIHYPKTASLNFYLRLGIEVVEMGNYKLGVEAFLSGFKQDKNTDIANNIAIAYRHLKQLDKALEYYQKSLVLDPNLSRTHFGLANVYYELGNFEKALEHYKISIKLYPRRVEAYESCSHIYWKLRLFDEAVESMIEALLHFQGKFSLYQIMADCFKQKGDSLLEKQILLGNLPTNIDKRLAEKNKTMWQFGSGKPLQIYHQHPPQVWTIFAPKTVNSHLHPSFRLYRRYSPETFVAQVVRGRAYYRTDISVATADNKVIPALSCTGAIAHPEKLPPLKHLGDRAIFIPQRLSSNYYHWTFDTLPRLALIEQAGFEIQPSDRIVINDLNLPFQRESLTQLNITPEQCFTSGNCHITAEELLIPTLLGDTNTIPTPWMVQFLREKFLPHPYPSPQRRLYICRNGANYRRVLNQAAVIELLKSHNFEIITPETLSFGEQIATFAAAEAIVAPHGAGNTNLTYCHPSIPVIELFAPDYVVDCYWLISAALGLDYHYCIGKPPRDYYRQQRLPQPQYFRNNCQDIWVDLEQLAATLLRLGL